MERLCLSSAWPPLESGLLDFVLTLTLCKHILVDVLVSSIDECTHDYVSCLSPHFFRAIAVSCVLTPEQSTVKATLLFDGVMWKFAAHPISSKDTLQKNLLMAYPTTQFSVIK